MCNYNIKFDDLNNFIKNYIQKSVAINHQSSNQIGSVNTNLSIPSSTKNKIDSQRIIENKDLNVLSNEIMKNDNLVFAKNDILNIQLFEIFFLKPLINHFESIFTEILKSEEMNLTYAKFKNLYLIDLSNENIIFDYLQAKNIKKAKKYYKNEKIWQEILYHSQGMKSAYIQEHGNNFNLSEDVYRVRLFIYEYLSLSN
jgi:hypothetical protein